MIYCWVVRLVFNLWLIVGRVMLMIVLLMNVIDELMIVVIVC